MDLLECIKSFVEIVDQNSFAQAADNLHSSSSALSKRINWLEEKLNTQLLNRTTRRLSLTDEGNEFYNRSLKLLDQWYLAETALNNKKKEPNGLIKLCVPAPFNNLLLPIINDFLEMYPKTRIECAMFGGNFDTLGGIDIFFWGEQEDSTLSTFKRFAFKDYETRFYAAPEYIKKYGMPVSEEDLPNHKVIANAYYNRLRNWHNEELENLAQSACFFTNSLNTMIQGAVLGMGIVMAPEPTVLTEVEKGLLVPVLNDIDNHGLPFTFSAYYQNQRFTSLTVKKFLQHISDALGGNSVIFEEANDESQLSD